MEDYRTILNAAKNNFLTDRTNREVLFEQWKRSVMTLPADFKARIPFDIESFDLKTEIPEWYVDQPDQKKCDEQYAAFKAKVDKYNALVDEVNAEAVAAVQMYNNLRSQI